MAGSIEKVSVGDPFRPKAATWNAFVDAAIANRVNQNLGGGLNPSAPTATAIRIRNTTGAAVARGDVVKLSAPEIGPTANLDTFKQHVGFSVVTPSDPEDKIAVIADGTASTEMGWAYVSGIVAAQITVAVDAPFLDRVAASATGFVLHPGGAHRVLWRETGVGTKWAWVQLNEHAPARYRGTTVGAIAVDTAGNVNIGTELGFGPGYNVSAELSWLHGGESISASKEVIVEWFRAESKWIITGAECE